MSDLTPEPDRPEAVPSKPPATSPHATAIPHVGGRAVVWVLVLVGVFHSILVMLWVMPTNPIRNVAGTTGQNFLSWYMYPTFDQSWSVFAPTPRRGGENVQFRVYFASTIPSQGQASTKKISPWYDITAREDQRIKYLVNPSRIHSATRRLGGNMNATVPKLNAAQQRLLTGAYTKTSTSVLKSNLLKANTAGAVGVSTVNTYMMQDEMLRRFTSMYAKALYPGKTFSMIQIRVGHRTVPNYQFRNTQNFLDVPFTYYTFGWRKTYVGSHDAQAAFDGYVK